MVRPCVGTGVKGQDEAGVVSWDPEALAAWAHYGPLLPRAASAESPSRKARNDEEIPGPFLSLASLIFKYLCMCACAHEHACLSVHVNMCEVAGIVHKRVSGA